MNNTNGTVFDAALYERLLHSYVGIESFYIIVGTFSSAWLMSAILTSPDMRLRLRNQIVCVMTLWHVFRFLLGIGFYLILMARYEMKFWMFPCQALTFVMFVVLIADFANTWYIIILLVVFLAQILNEDLSQTLTPTAQTLGKIVLLSAPSVLGIIILPSVGEALEPGQVGSIDSCIYITVDSLNIFRTLDYLLPFAICVVTMAVTSVFYCRRFHCGINVSQGIRPELMGRGPQVDNIKAYIVVVSIVVVCRFWQSTAYFMETGMDVNQKLIFLFVSSMLGDAVPVVTPWVWLLLEDVRDRIKTWRPWYRPAPGIDLTMTYDKRDPE